MQHIEHIFYLLCGIRSLRLLTVSERRVGYSYLVRHSHRNVPVIERYFRNLRIRKNCPEQFRFFYIMKLILVRVKLKQICFIIYFYHYNRFLSSGIKPSLLLYLQNYRFYPRIFQTSRIKSSFFYTDPELSQQKPAHQKSLYLNPLCKHR